MAIYETGSTVPRYLALALMVGMTLVLAVCGGVSDEEFESVQEKLTSERASVEAVQQELTSERTMVADLKEQLAGSEVVQQELTSERTMVADLKEQLAKALATPTPLGPLAVADAYAAALSAGDIDALVELWADDAVSSFGPSGPGGEFETSTGKAEVLKEDLEAIADNSLVTLSNSSLQGNTVIGEFLFTDDDTASFGFPVTGTFEAVVEAGTIKSLTTTLSEETQAALNELFGPPPGPPPQAGEVTFTAFDTDDGHRFRGPDSLPAGWTTLRLSNEESQASHHMQLIQLPEGMTIEDLFAAFARPGPPPAGLKFSGGVGSLFAGGSGLATVNLAPGNYVMACFIPDDNGVPHAFGGMVKPFTVTAATEPTAAEPQAVATVEVSESGFSLSGSIPAGVQTVRVTNSGQAPHEAIVAQLAPGASGSDFLASLLRGGPAPGKLLGGLQAIDGGGTGYFTAVFEPGNHAFIEFESGVTQEFTVQ